MVGWIILGVIVLLVIIICLIPVGADLRYEDEVIRISLRVAGVHIQIVPNHKKDKKKKPPKEEKPKDEEKADTTVDKKKKKRSFSFSFEEILDLIKTVIQGFGKFGRKFKVERFVLHWIAPMWDPYVSARIFSIVNAAMSELAPVCTERFHCRNSSVWTDIDFERDRMFLEFCLVFTIRIGQIIGTALRIAFEALQIFLRSRRRNKKEEKEETAALRAWLKEHPEDAAIMQETDQVA